MCCNCGDWIGMCCIPECVKAHGGPNGIGSGSSPSRCHHFYAGDGVPCEHVRAEHDPHCPAQQGNLCTYEGTCDPDYEEEVRQALTRLDGTTETAVQLLTGMPKERLDDLGGFKEEK